MRHRILFICHRRNHYWGEEQGGNGNSLSSGLLNSALFIAEMLSGLGVEAKVVEVDDNNCIDREVTQYRPSHVVIEALWVVPEKFDVLRPLHPHVRWIVRLHSKASFLANEGIAMEWIHGYLSRGIEVQCNNKDALHELRVVAHSLGWNSHLVTHLPNYYPAAPTHHARPQLDRRAVHIGCFGAVRPLKNHLAQAVAAIAFADDLRAGLRFHINGSRVEGRGEPMLKNLRAIFSASPRHDLVEHAWAPHAEFLETMKSMDLAMQVSFSETFNIVTADAVASGVPVITSPEVSWIGDYAMADPNDGRAIIDALWRAWETPKQARLFAQRRDLSAFSAASENAWAERFGR